MGLLSTSDAWISIEEAVQEFGPCEGGYENARIRILRKIAANPAFNIQLVGKPPKAPWTKGYSGDLRAWFGGLVDEDELPPELLEWLKDRANGPRINFGQTRAIWIDAKPEGWIADSDLNPVWNETETLAWLATQDSYIVGQSQNMQKLGKIDNYIGLLSYVSSENCQIPFHQKDNLPKWKTCHCLTLAWDQLRRFSRSRAISESDFSLLRYDLQAGRIQFELPKSNNTPSFLKKHVLQFCPAPDSTLPLAQENARLQTQIKTGSAGRPSKGKSLYLAEFHRRNEEGQLHKKLSEESRHLKEWFQKHHPLADQPTTKTIENTIRPEFNAAKARKLDPRN